MKAKQFYGKSFSKKTKQRDVSKWYGRKWYIIIPSLIIFFSFCFVILAVLVSLL